jgi:hypothetical protein
VFAVSKVAACSSRAVEAGEERLHSMRWVRLLVLPVLVALVVACGGGDDEDGNDSGGSDGGSNTPAASTAGGSAGGGGSNASGGGGGSDGGGSLPEDFDEIAELLEPPNANETSRFSTNDGLVVGWESSDSVESLKNHYDDAIADAGFNVIGTTSISGTHQWLIGNEDGSGYAGSVSIAPNSGSGSSVGITVTPSNSSGSGPSTGSGASGGSGGANAEGDVDEMVGRLEPPNATEVSRFSSSDGVVIAWESTDSVESVKGFYDDAIEEAGLNVYGTTDVQGTHSWVISEDSGTGYNGSVTIGPSNSGNGTSVSALLGFTQ